MVAAARSTTPEDATSPVRELVIPDPSSSVRWHEHDWPHPLARWHYHPEVEVHLIRESSGTVMAGDWAGPFGPGHLSLMGSFLPHNWISHRDDDAVGEVSDDGGEHGRRLLGMRERVAVYGGELTAAASQAGGWQIKARLPLGVSA